MIDMKFYFLLFEANSDEKKTKRKVLKKRVRNRCEHQRLLIERECRSFAFAPSFIIFSKNLYLTSIAEQTIALNISMALPKSKEQNQRALNSEHENDFKK